MRSGSSVLQVGATDIQNVFQLVGDNEDSISLAIAWGLKNSRGLLQSFLQAALGKAAVPETLTIRIHRHEVEAGITDIEITAPGIFHVIVEAKKGWILPGEHQLRRYAQRESFSGKDKGLRRLVTLSEVSETYASSTYPRRQVQGVPVVHVSWKSLARWCEQARRKAGHAEARLLRELGSYLEGLMSSQRQDSNLVYVVSLGSGTPDGWKVSWIDIVAKYGRYFHPVGKGWPKEPPNYLAFRYGGQLQSIHHVEAYEVVTDLSGVCPGIARCKRPPHFVYRLGKSMVPTQTVKTGSIYPSGRVWCALDTLLTSRTVSEARDETLRRKSAARA